MTVMIDSATHQPDTERTGHERRRAIQSGRELIHARPRSSNCIACGAAGSPRSASDVPAAQSRRRKPGRIGPEQPLPFGPQTAEWRNAPLDAQRWPWVAGVRPDCRADHRPAQLDQLQRDRGSRQAQPLQRKRRPGRGDALRSRRLLGGFGCRAIGGAQIGPVDLGAHGLAAHGAIGGALDGWAMLNRHASSKPLGDRTWGYPHNSGQGALASENFCRSFNWVHAESLAALDFDCQGGLNHFFFVGLTLGACPWEHAFAN